MALVLADVQDLAVRRDREGPGRAGRHREVPGASRAARAGPRDGSASAGEPRTGCHERPRRRHEPSRRTARSVRRRRAASPPSATPSRGTSPTCGRCRDGGRAGRRRASRALRSHARGARRPPDLGRPGDRRGRAPNGGRAGRPRCRPCVVARRRRVPAWYRWVAAVAGAAAVVVLAASSSAPTSAAAPRRPPSRRRRRGGAVAPIAPASRVEVQDVDYDSTAVQAIAAVLRRAAAPALRRPGVRSGVPQAATGNGGSVTQEGRTSTTSSGCRRPPRACRKAFADPPGRARAADPRPASAGPPPTSASSWPDPAPASPRTSSRSCGRREARLRGPALDHAGSRRSWPRRRPRE